MFHTKILEIRVLLSSFDFIRKEYKCNWTKVYWPNVLTERFSILYKNQTKDETSF